MSQASTAAVAVSAVNVSSQLDPVNESPYPKWSSSTPASVAPSQDGFQGTPALISSTFQLRELKYSRWQQYNFYPSFDLIMEIIQTV